MFTSEQKEQFLSVLEIPGVRSMNWWYRKDGSEIRELLDIHTDGAMDDVAVRLKEIIPEFSGQKGGPFMCEGGREVTCLDLHHTGHNGNVSIYKSRYVESEQKEKTG